MRKLLILASLLLLLPACTVEKRRDPLPPASLRAAILVAPVDFSGQQYQELSSQLSALPAEVRTYSIQAIRARADDGMEVAAEALPENLAGQADLLAVVGGSGMEILAGDNALAASLAAFSQAGKPVGFLAEGRALLEGSGLRLLASEPAPSPPGAIIEAVDATKASLLAGELAAAARSSHE
jgi:putative intracellular protease/amidase